VPPNENPTATTRPSGPTLFFTAFATWWKSAVKQAETTVGPLSGYPPQPRAFKIATEKPWRNSATAAHWQYVSCDPPVSPASRIATPHGGVRLAPLPSGFCGVQPACNSQSTLCYSFLWWSVVEKISPSYGGIGSPCGRRLHANPHMVCRCPPCNIAARKKSHC